MEKIYMSVANSLVDTTTPQQIAALVSQISALTSSVSANATQINSLVEVTAQAITTLSIPDTGGYPFVSQDVEILYDDAVIPGNYAFKISGVLASATGANNTAVLELENTAAGATYALEIAGALKDTTVSYTGFFTYATGGPFPKISVKYIVGDTTNWGWASLSIVFFRLQTAP